MELFGKAFDVPREILDGALKDFLQVNWKEFESRTVGSLLKEPAVIKGIVDRLENGLKPKLEALNAKLDKGRNYSLMQEGWPEIEKDLLVMLPWALEEKGNVDRLLNLPFLLFREGGRARLKEVAERIAKELGNNPEDFFLAFLEDRIKNPRGDAKKTLSDLEKEYHTEVTRRRGMAVVALKELVLNGKRAWGNLTKEEKAHVLTSLMLKDLFSRKREFHLTDPALMAAVREKLGFKPGEEEEMKKELVMWYKAALGSDHRVVESRLNIVVPNHYDMTELSLEELSKVVKPLYIRRHGDGSK